MRKFAYLYMVMLLSIGLTSCFDETTWEEYEDWRNEQNDWLNQELKKTDENGKPFYEAVPASFDRNSIVYMHFYNDRDKYADNLVPLYTSTVDVKYHGRFYNDEPFDSSYTSTSPADSVARFGVNSVISGWSIALMNMHVGDSVKVIIPYNVAYGEGGYGSKIPPYTLLVFQLKLTDIYKYEAK
ncbi:MAG: FKBP-type peptidyl-prolyl cis-trans isomerase [Muribaculaceae bacterium]